MTTDSTQAAISDYQDLMMRLEHAIQGNRLPGHDQKSTRQQTALEKCMRNHDRLEKVREIFLSVERRRNDLDRTRDRSETDDRLWQAFNDMWHQLSGVV